MFTDSQRSVLRYAVPLRYALVHARRDAPCVEVCVVSLNVFFGFHAVHDVPAPAKEKNIADDLIPFVELDDSAYFPKPLHLLRVTLAVDNRYVVILTELQRHLIAVCLYTADGVEGREVYYVL